MNPASSARKSVALLLFVAKLPLYQRFSSSSSPSSSETPTTTPTANTKKTKDRSTATTLPPPPQQDHRHQRCTLKDKRVNSSTNHQSSETTHVDNVLEETEQAERSSSQTPPPRHRPLRRCLLSVPGADARKIQKAVTTLGGRVDTIVLDLEDGVAFNYKEQARALVQETLLDESMVFGNHTNETSSSSSSSSELAVRINALDTNDTNTGHNNCLAVQDLQAILPCPRLQAIVIPKVECAEHVHFVSRMIDALSPAPQHVVILAAIESARGMLNLRDIIAATASSGSSSNGSSKGKKHKLDGLIFASEDYCNDIGAIRTTAATELLYARSHLVTCAKAYHLQAMDMVHIQYKDLDALAVECRTGRELGFTGKQAIHPCQVATIQECYAPSPQDVDYARKCVVAYEATTALGRGACVVNGIVVDLPVYKWAVSIVNGANQATAAGMLPSLP